MEGIIRYVNIKGETENERGLPKKSLESAYLEENGLRGDHNNYRNSYMFLGNKLNRAVLIFPIEMIAQLKEEGWPIKPGDLGENLNTEGIPYESFSLGSKYRIGTDAIVEIAEICKPCRHLSVLPYVGEERKKSFISTMVGRRGWYARVIVPGLVRQDDAINLVDNSA